MGRRGRQDGMRGGSVIRRSERVSRGEGNTTQHKTTQHKTQQYNREQQNRIHNRTPYHLPQYNTPHHTTPIPDEIFLFTTSGRKVPVQPGRTVLVEPGERIDWTATQLMRKTADDSLVLLTIDDIIALRDKMLGYNHAWIDDEYAAAICDVVRFYTSLLQEGDDDSD